MTFDDCIAIRTLFGECRSEPVVGQRAVAHVIRNRLKTGKFGSTPAEVCLTHAQFSCWLQSGQTVTNWHTMVRLPDDDPQIEALGQVWTLSETDPDFTGGATFYFSEKITPPYWAAQFKYVGQWGTQKFYVGT